VEIGLSGDAYNSAQGTRGTAVANADGSWSMNLPIDRSTPPGAQPLLADCGASGHADSWSYPSGTTITITTTYYLSVSPGTTVTAGTTLSVTGEGSCPIPSIPWSGFAQDAQVGIGANIDGIESFDGQSNGVANTWAGTDQLGNWSTTITVPATTPPGVYSVSAGCTADRSFYAYYNPVSITVVAPGSRPVHSSSPVGLPLPSALPRESDRLDRPGSSLGLQLPAELLDSLRGSLSSGHAQIMVGRCDGERVIRPKPISGTSGTFLAS
jgi:hypothetical protein